MKRLSPITRIAFGLTSLSTTLILAAATLGLVPDRREMVIGQRRALAETVAINCSLFASRADPQSIETSLQQIAGRNPDLLSACVRRSDGTVFVEVSRRGPRRGREPKHESGEMKVSVPIIAGKHRWGAVELFFRPLSTNGVASLFSHPLTQMLFFLGVAGFVAFYFYMRATLQYLDPSKVMPERVRQALDTLSEGLMVVDKRERIVHTNEAFSRLVGKSGVDLRGRNASQLSWLPAEGSQLDRYPWSQAVNTAAFETGVKLGLDVEGLGVRTFLVNTSSITDDNGQSRGALVSLDDVTALEASRTELRKMLDKLQRSRDEIQRQNRALEEIAKVDPLTSCLNRRAFYAEFEALWNVARRYGKPLSCVMVDIDHFKSVNDTYGHRTGDEVLQSLSQLLRKNARDCDLVCRYGGEEFCILLPETDIEGACQLADRTRNDIELSNCSEVAVTVSMGVSTIGFGAHDSRELLDQADQALYAAKSDGRNQVVRFDEVPEIAELDGATVSGQRIRHEQEETALIPFAAVSALMSALSFRDSDTAAHCHRVADLCSFVAQDLMSPSEIYILEMAALLHDIGKIGVPDAILLKRGRLTEEEWRVMRMHDQIGVAIVQEAFGAEELTTLVGSHHAWYGGNPENPSSPNGDDIPLGARILSIAEAYDAMVSDSVYRPACSPGQAFEELRACAGRQFDPALVDRFIAHMNERNMREDDSAKPLSKDAITSIAKGAEELAAALEKQETPTVAIIAQRLKLIGASHNANELREAAKELEELAADNGDVMEMAAGIGDLMEMCREMQRSYLSGQDACDASVPGKLEHDQFSPCDGGPD